MYWVYLLVSLTVYLILYGWYCQIGRILTNDVLGVSIGQPDSPSNIIWMILLDQPDTPLNIHWVYLLVSLTVYPILPGWHCRISRIPTEYSLGVSNWSAWQSIQYCLDDTVESGGYPLNIHWVYLLVSLTVHPILSRWYCWISRIPTEYSLGVSIG